MRDAAVQVNNTIILLFHPINETKKKGVSSMHYLAGSCMMNDPPAVEFLVTGEIAYWLALDVYM